MVMSSTGVELDNDCAGEGQQKLQTTDPFSRLRGQLTSTNPHLSDSNKNLVLGSRWVLDTKTDWPTDLSAVT
jgi:hypothetical protein